MSFDWIAITIIGFGILTGLAALLIVCRRNWLFAWLRGTLGMSALVISIGIICFGRDLYTYRSIPEYARLGVVQIYQVDDDHYSAIFKDPQGNEQSLQQTADFWQLNIRTFNWKGSLRPVGLDRSFRINSLSDAASEGTQVSHNWFYALIHSLFHIDAWALVQKYDPFSNVVDVGEFSIAFKATEFQQAQTFNLELTPSGARLRPVKQKSVG
jgi:hypothetical protein